MNDERTRDDVIDLSRPGKVYYTSDPHYFHPRIIELCGRPFKDVYHMNEVMVSNYNATVTPADTCWFLGDIVLSKPFEENMEILSRLNGYKILIPGNHDRVAWAFHRKGSDESRREKRQQYYHLYRKYFDVVLSDRDQMEQYFPDLGEDLQISHYPYVGDSHDKDRYSELRPVDDGGYLVHGHVHEKWRTNGRMFNVGVDVNDFTPVAQETIVAWVKEHRALSV